MPSFVNNENTPAYSANSGVIRLDASHSRHYPVKQAPHEPSAVAIGRPDEDSLDDLDNSSSQSSDTLDQRSRPNGRPPNPSANMMHLPNGARPARGFPNGAPPSLGDAAPIETRKPQNPHNGWPLASTDRTSADARPIVNGRSSNTTAPPPHPPPPTPYHGFMDGATPRRTSIESTGRSSIQPPSIDGVASRSSMANGDRTPRVSHDVAAAGGPMPTIISPPESNIQRPPNSPAHRFSAPSQYNAAGSSPSATSPALQPPNQLKHRHTLEVPKAQQGRGSKDGSGDAAFASGRFSPTVAGPSGRRPSLSLGRRNTRSLHSEVPRDEVTLDEDAQRWAEAYRQKRAKKKRREELDDDKVLVGTKVDENHANWTTAYNMLTGIRVSVSRTNAKLDRPLTDADFDAKQKSTFDITGNELVPSAKYDFKFKDYAPWVFRHLRALFRLDPADYLMSLTGKYILSELGSPGKSGSFFYFSRDYKYIIKTIHHGEHKFLRKILKEYYNHVTDNPNTLLSQFYGLHRVKMPWSGKKIHFVVMNNLFPPHRDIHQTFDLKGSTVGRDYREEDLEKNPRATLKDLNWLRRKRHLELGLAKKQLFLQQLERDVRLMQKLQIMDYSLLIGIHDLKKGNEENLRGKTLQVFNPGGDDAQEDIDPHQVLMRTPSKLESARKARELRQMIKAERPVPIGEGSTPMPEELEEGFGRSGVFYNDDGGLRATHEDNTLGQEIYYLGVIDCLTHVSTRRLLRGKPSNSFCAVWNDQEDRALLEGSFQRSQPDIGPATGRVW